MGKRQRRAPCRVGAAAEAAAMVAAMPEAMAAAMAAAMVVAMVHMLVRQRHGMQAYTTVAAAAASILR